MWSNGYRLQIIGFLFATKQLLPGRSHRYLPQGPPVRGSASFGPGTKKAKKSFLAEFQQLAFALTAVDRHGEHAVSLTAKALGWKLTASIERER